MSELEQNEAVIMTLQSTVEMMEKTLYDLSFRAANTTDWYRHANGAVQELITFGYGLSYLSELYLPHLDKITDKHLEEIRKKEKVSEEKKEKKYSFEITEENLTFLEKLITEKQNELQNSKQEVTNEKI